MSGNIGSESVMRIIFEAVGREWPSGSGEISCGSKQGVEYNTISFKEGQTHRKDMSVV